MFSALELVKVVYKRFSENDIDGFLALCADDIEWVVNGPPALVVKIIQKSPAGIRLECREPRAERVKQGSICLIPSTRKVPGVQRNPRRQRILEYLGRNLAVL